MSSTLLSTFEQYQKARVQFAQAVAEAATRPQNIDTMQNAGVMQLLRPLLLDNVSLAVGLAAILHFARAFLRRFLAFSRLQRSHWAA